MATKITFKQSPGTSRPSLSVNESVSEVASLINTALENKHPFVALTDARTNKEVSIKAGTVSNFEEE